METPLPPQIADSATLRGNEYAWPLQAFPEALKNAESLGYACLGGQFQFLIADGTYEMYWLSADSSERRQGESWLEYCRRSCEEVLSGFNRAVRQTDFRKEAALWPALDRAAVHGFDIHNRLVFVAYFVTEAELNDLRTKSLA